MAIVVSRVPYQENDLILGLLCRSGGLVSVVARSARSSRRRFQGMLDFFVVFNAGYARGKGGMPVLASAEPVKFFPGILENLDLLETGLALIKTVREMLRDAPPSPSLFDEVVLSFEYLEKADPSLAHMVMLECVLAVAVDLGHVPEGNVCPACGRPASGFAVSPDGQVLCTDRCHPGGGQFLTYPVEYAVRRPLMDNPALTDEPWKPDRETANGIVSALVAGITGFPWQPGGHQR